MSTVAFGALATRREQSDSGKSTSDQPPGLNMYIDVLAALVPAEVLAIQAFVISAVVSTNSHGQTQVTEPNTLRWAFWLLVGLCGALFVLGRRPVPTSPDVRVRSGGTAPRWQRWEWQDLIRLLVPPAAFVGWTMLQPSSVWNAVVPGMSTGMRLLIPLVGAVLLGAVTKALATHSDKKPPAVRQVNPAARPPAAPAPAARPPAVPPPAVPPPAAPPPAAPPPTTTPEPALTALSGAPAPEHVPVAIPAAPAPAPDATGGDPVPSWVYWSQEGATNEPG